MSYPYRFYAVVIPGLENIAVKELEALSAHEIQKDSGGVHFSGTMETMFRVNLRSRCITRVLLRLKRFTALSLNDIQKKVQQVDWGHFLDAHTILRVHASCHSSKLMHTVKIETEINETIKKSGFSSVSDNVEQQVFIRIENNRCLLSIDTSGERLDRRAYRLESGKAPVRETLAAGILQWMGWPSQEPLMVPMCGSGTFAIEAAMAGIKQAPDLTHKFPFLVWPQLKQKAWERLLHRSEAMTKKDTKKYGIFASDIHTGAIEITARNAERAGVEKLIQTERKDVLHLTPPDGFGSGLMICNPPYGRRIDADVKSLYSALGRVFEREFKGWRMAIFSPDYRCEKALGLPVKDRLKIKHGGHYVEILHIAI
ncbi:MAG: class I SAM-dependent RNA methyltransferase [Mariprofundaceae bacterium]